MIEPLLFNKDLGRPLQLGDPLPRTNADGLPIVPLTQEQKYVFDTRGWLLVPGVLSADQIEPMRDFIYQLDRDQESLPEKQRTIFGFPLHPLMDHPVVVGFIFQDGHVGDPRYARDKFRKHPMHGGKLIFFKPEAK